MAKKKNLSKIRDGSQKLITKTNENERTGVYRVIGYGGGGESGVSVIIIYTRLCGRMSFRRGESGSKRGRRIVRYDERVR